jgi:hypothetical protein
MAEIVKGLDEAIQKSAVDKLLTKLDPQEENDSDVRQAAVQALKNFGVSAWRWVLPKADWELSGRYFHMLFEWVTFAPEETRRQKEPMEQKIEIAGS